MTRPLDAGLLVAFGGSEKPDDIAPFLANVTRGRPIPPARIAEVAHHDPAFIGMLADLVGEALAGETRGSP